MTITTLEKYRTSRKQTVFWQKQNGANFGLGLQWFCGFTNLGNGTPAAGGSAGNTANGVIPDNTTTGAAALQTNAGADMHLSKVKWWGNAAQRLILFDRIFAAGTYNQNAGTTTLTSQPSYSSCVPGGTDYTGLQIWIENVTSQGTSQSITVTYTDQDGNTGHTTGAQTVSMPSTNGTQMLPLQAGDVGVQKIESVVTGAAGLGCTWNVVVVRPLWMGVVRYGNDTRSIGLEEVGFPWVRPNACLTTAQQSAALCNYTVEAETASI